MRATFAADKRRPGAYLARVEVTGEEPWPDLESELELTRKDGTTARVLLGDRVVWSGPDGEREGVEVALYTIAKSLDSPVGRAPPKRAAAPRGKPGAK